MTGVAGTENHLLTLLPSLKARGLAPSLLVLTEPAKPLDDYVAHLNQLGIPAAQMEIRRDVDLPLMGRLAAYIRSSGAEAVHTHLIHADWHGIPAARRAGIKHIYTSGHNDDQFRYKLPIRLIQAYLWRRINAGIAISEAVRQFMLKVEFAPPRKVHTVHYGYQPQPFDPSLRENFRRELNLPLDAPVFGSVCRLIEQKGLPYALQSFAAIADEFPHAYYVLIGDGLLREALQTQAAALGIADRIRFAGWRADAAARMVAFDVFLMPSLWEGFGLVMLEAMAARLPIIASKVSALPEIVQDGVTGLLAPPRDVDRLAAHMRYLLRDRQAAQRMGQAGEARLKAEFSVDKMADRTLAVYQSAL
ncbi:MAG: glycosyltransferase [Anaerolineae bacterium]